MESPIESFAAAAAIVAALWGAGRPIVRWLAPDAELVPGGLLSIALGAIAWQTLLALFVASRCWRAAPVSMLTLLGATWGLIEAAAWLGPRAMATTGALSGRRPAWIAIALAGRFSWPPALACALFAASLGLVFTLAPPTRGLLPTEALVEAHRVAASGSASALSDGLLTPGVGATLLYAWADRIGDPAAVCLLNGLAGIFFACCAAWVATPLLGWRHALPAGAIVLIAPLVGGRLAYPAGELAPASLLLLAVAAWWRATVEFGGARWRRIAALLVSGAIGPAASLATVLFLVWKHAQAPDARAALARDARRDDRTPFGPAPRLAPIEQLLAGAPLLLLGVGCLVAAVVSGGAVRTLAECFGSPALGCGPFLLAAAPGMWWARRLRGMRRLATGGIVFVAGTAVFSPATAALLLAALLAIAATWVWLEIERFPVLQRGIARAALVALAATTAWTTLAGERFCWPPGLSNAGRERYLSARVGCYRAAKVANAILRPTDHLLTNDPQAYWIRCQATDQRVCSAELMALDAEPARPISDWLRERKITHLLLVDSPTKPDREGELLTRLVDRELVAEASDVPAFSAGASGVAASAFRADGALAPLVEYVKTSAGQARRYRLIAVRRQPISKSGEPAPKPRLASRVSAGASGAASRQ